MDRNRTRFSTTSSSVKSIIPSKRYGRKSLLIPRRTSFNSIDTCSETEASSTTSVKKEYKKKRKNKSNKNKRETKSITAPVTDEEKKVIKELKTEIENIERRKQLDIENLEGWKIERKWEIKQQLFLQSQHDGELDHLKKTIIKSKKHFGIVHLEQNKNSLRNEIVRLEKEMKKSMALNIQLRQEYAKHEASCERKKQKYQIARRNYEQLMAFETHFRLLQKECELQEAAYESNKRLNIKFQNAIDNIVQLLEDRCNDTPLLMDVVDLASTTRPSRSNSASSDDSSESTLTGDCSVDVDYDSKSCESNDNIKSTESHHYHHYLQEQEQEQQEQDQVDGSNDGYPSDDTWEQQQESIEVEVTEEDKTMKKPSVHDLFLSAHSYTMSLEDDTESVTESSTGDRIFVASENPIVKVDPYKRAGDPDAVGSLHERIFEAEVEYDIFVSNHSHTIHERQDSHDCFDDDDDESVLNWEHEIV